MNGAGEPSDIDMRSMGEAREVGTVRVNQRSEWDERHGRGAAKPAMTEGEPRKSDSGLQSLWLAPLLPTPEGRASARLGRHPPEAGCPDTIRDRP